MTNFIRKFLDEFAGNNKNDELTIFGSTGAGSPSNSSDPEVLQSNSKFREGWKGATLLNAGNLTRNPVQNEWSALNYIHNYQINHILQKGMQEWNILTEYFIGDKVSSGVIIYKSLTNNNIGNAVTDVVNWEVVGKISNIPITIEVIRSEADLAAVAPLELAPDGVMRYKLKKSVQYLFDTPFIILNFGIWFEDQVENGVACRLESTTLTFVLYTGTDTFFFARAVAQVESRHIFWSPNIPGTKLVDGQGSLKAGVLPFWVMDLSGLIGWDMGVLSDFETIIWTEAFTANHTEGLTCNNIRNITFSENPVLEFTGGVNWVYITGNCSSQKIERTSPQLASGDSLFCIDKGTNYTGQITLDDIAYDASGGALFFQDDVTGSIASIADLSLIITGSSLNFTEHSSGFTIVTQVGHDAYQDVLLDFIGTTNYNGNIEVISKLGVNEFLINIAYVGDELGVGSYTAVGSRITTTAPHNLTPHRFTEISATANYDGDVLIGNPNGSVFDIVTPFVITETGTFLSSSKDETDIDVNARVNGDAPSSVTEAQTSLADPATVIGSGAAYTIVNGVNWKEINAERFTTDTAGLVTYIGKNPKKVRISFVANIEKVGGGSDDLRGQIFFDGAAIPSPSPVQITEGRTQNTTPTQIAGEAIIELVTGSTLQVAVFNNSGAADVIVNSASLLVFAL